MAHPQREATIVELEQWIRSLPGCEFSVLVETGTEDVMIEIVGPNIPGEFITDVVDCDTWDNTVGHCHSVDGNVELCIILDQELCVSSDITDGVFFESVPTSTPSES